MNKYLRVYVLSAVTASVAILAALAVSASIDFELYVIALVALHLVTGPVLMVAYGIQA
jgi:multidrug efflux pump subunit AcrB